MLKRKNNAKIILIIIYITIFYSLLLSQDNIDIKKGNPNFEIKGMSSEFQANFYYKPAFAAPGLRIKFYNMSKGGPESYQWNFGDGKVSEEKDPSHAYVKSGIYYITLKISRLNLNSFIGKSIFVRSNYSGNSEKPKADFIFEPTNPQAGEPIKFYDRSVGIIENRIWQFGYFGYSFLKEPTWTFFSSKKYVVTLTVKNQFGSDRIAKYIDVAPRRVNVIIAQSCALADVQAAIAQANPGDTVVVPNGTATWGNQLIINKGIILKAATKGGVNIKSSYEYYSSDNHDTRNYLIVYQPQNPENDEPFRISGFILDFQSKISGLIIKNLSLNAIRKIRIDNNKIYNPRGMVIQIYGNAYGVMDNCYIESPFTVGLLRDEGNSNNTWQNFTFEFGTADNFYFEDLHIVSPDTMVMMAEVAGRYCLRYSIIDATTSTNGLYPMCDMHGNQTSTNFFATMGAEVYGNTIYCNKGVCLVDQRGGKAIVYDNNVITSSSVTTKVREEYLDSITPPANNPISGQPQHVSDSYYWNLKKNGAVLYTDNPYIASTVYYEDLGRNVPAEDIDFWRHKSSFDGSSGVGVGLLSQRPISCTKEGVAWWATDEKKLYRWHNGKWELFYIPYTYPHPLRALLND